MGGNIQGYSVTMAGHVPADAFDNGASLFNIHEIIRYQLE